MLVLNYSAECPNGHPVEVRPGTNLAREYLAHALETHTRTPYIVGLDDCGECQNSQNRNQIRYCNEHIHRDPEEAVVTENGLLWCPARQCYISETVAHPDHRSVYCPGCGGHIYINYAELLSGEYPGSSIDCRYCYNGIVTAQQAGDIIDRLIEVNREANQQIGRPEFVTDEAEFYDFMY